MTINKTIGREIGMFFPKFLTLLFSQKKKKKFLTLFLYSLDETSWSHVTNMDNAHLRKGNT